jgi:uncharacterized protein YjbI with pentapeptide repeats
MPKAVPSEQREADDNSVSSAASTARKLWIAFVSYQILVLVALLSIGHRQLFLNSLIELPTIPILNLKVGSLTTIEFFVAVPLLLLLHGALLFVLHNVVSSNRASAADKAAALRERVFTIPGAGWITVVAFPVFLFVFIQMRFLPYHNEAVTWIHRGALVADLALLWVFWLVSMRSGMGAAQTLLSAVFVLLTVAALIFSIVIATFPGEPTDENIFARGTPIYRWVFLGSDLRGPVDALSPNVLVLPNQQFDDKLPLGDRDLRGAVLTRSRLRNANLTAADLRGADLWGATLQDALLDGAKLQNADVREAHLEGASLAGAHFEVADLRHAHFAGSKALQKDDQPHFEGADLANADFRAAYLLSGQFQAANLEETDFRGARLDNASFWGASFEGTQLDAAHLMPVTLWHTTPVNISTCFVQSAQPAGPGRPL